MSASQLHISCLFVTRRVLMDYLCICLFSSGHSFRPRYVSGRVGSKSVTGVPLYDVADHATVLFSALQYSLSYVD